MRKNFNEAALRTHSKSIVSESVCIAIDLEGNLNFEIARLGLDVNLIIVRARLASGRAVSCTGPSVNGSRITAMAVTGSLCLSWLVFLSIASQTQGQGCSKAFLDKVQVCHAEVDGMPLLLHDTLLAVDSFEKITAHCRRNASAFVRQCFTQLYECPEHVATRERCDLASLYPEILAQRMDLTCRFLDTIKRELACVNEKTCAVKNCLATIPQQSDVISFAILSPPRKGSSCDWLDKVKVCYETHLRRGCSATITSYMTAMLDTHKPPSCSPQQYTPMSLTLSSTAIKANSKCVLSTVVVLYGLLSHSRT
ncbi:uncharacterized protein LOC124136056 [Haliotis rufescens]|uniref:uncharacterized protein LOC124136056 n=1 Tax=Haliotis rufescens TaxID=6454 RepID=UPI00201F92B0|nr:uncharacterized protein LOC124136056 [Haliotis rufescens]